jgi:hypothetical protein
VNVYEVLKAVGARTRALDADTAAVAARTQALDTDVAAVAARTQALDTDVATVATRTQALDADTATVATRTRALDADMAAVAARTQALDTNVATVATRTQAGDPSRTGVATRIRPAVAGAHPMVQSPVEPGGALEMSGTTVATCALASDADGTNARTRTALLDTSMLSVATIDAEPRTRRIMRLDIQSALCLMNIPFALCLNAHEYRRAVHSLRLDTHLMGVLADITGDPVYRTWAPGGVALRVDSRLEVPRAVYEHAVICEYAHERLLGGARNRH